MMSNPLQRLYAPLQPLKFGLCHPHSETPLGSYQAPFKSQREQSQTDGHAEGIVGRSNSGAGSTSGTTSLRVGYSDYPSQLFHLNRNNSPQVN